MHSHREYIHTGSEHSDASPASPASPPRSHAPGGAGARRRAYRSTVEIRRHSVLGVGLNCVVHVLDVNYDENFSCWKVFRRRKAPKVHRGSVCPKRTIPIVSIRILILTNPILILMNFASQVQRLSASSLLNQFSRVLAAFSNCSLSFECSARMLLELFNWTEFESTNRLSLQVKPRLSRPHKSYEFIKFLIPFRFKCL